MNLELPWRLKPNHAFALELYLTGNPDAMPLALTAGTRREGKVHGLSIYYPTTGVSQEDTYLDLAFNALPDAAWQQFMAAVARASWADLSGPRVSFDSSSSARKGAGNDRGANDLVYVGSLEDPVSMVFNLKDDGDAYGFYAALVSNVDTDDPNEHIYFGEIANGLADGPGSYELLWDTMALTLSGDPDGALPYLGGWFQEADSNIMVSYADYVAPGEKEPVEVVLLTELGDTSARIIQVLHAAGDTLSAVSGLTLKPGGKLTPIYYTELRNGEPETWETYDVYFEDEYIVVPEGGMEAISVEYLPVALGEYTVEIMVTDVFDNEGDILNFPVLVLEDIKRLPRTPTLGITRPAAGQIKISWAQVDGGHFSLQSTPSLSDAWSKVPDETITYDADSGQEFVILPSSDTQQFYRLFRK
jgi:hypothetical protein